MRYLRLVLLGLVVSGALLAVPTPDAHGATFAVTKTDDTADGTCDADCSLREAVIAIKPTGPDTIQLPAGTYTLSIPGMGEDDGKTGDLDISTDVTIIGEGADSTIIDGAMLDRIFHIHGPINVDISGVTIRNGNAIAGGPPEPAGAFHGDGGGILFEADGGGGLTVSDATVSGNFAEGFGGGIANDNKDHLTVTNSTISGNEATVGGGGIYNEPNIGAFVNLSLVESMITGNTSEGTGGGILNDGAATLTDSTVSGNTSAGGSGGGIYIGFLSTATLTNSTVSGNIDGGGIFNGGSALTLTNSTVSGNTSNGNSGGIFNGGGALTLTNSTVSGNTADDAGGGIDNNVGTVSLKNTIVANNTAAIDNDCTGMINSNGYNLDSDGTCNLTGPGDLPDTNPNLGPLADNGGPTQTHALLAGSPAIDSASDDCPPPDTDQRGVTRPQGPACDIGAYEVEVAAAPTPTPSAAELPAGGGGPAGGCRFPWLALVVGGLVTLSGALVLARQLGRISAEGGAP